MKFVKLNKEAQIPTRATRQSAGYDLNALEAGVLAPGSRTLINTGIGIEDFHEDFYGQIFGKSSLGNKLGIQVLAGVIDSDYKGEIKVVLYNSGNYEFKWEKHQSIAQLVILKYETTSEETPKEERNGGFGSTNKDKK